MSNISEKCIGKKRQILLLEEWNLCYFSINNKNYTGLFSFNKIQAPNPGKSEYV